MTDQTPDPIDVSLHRAITVAVGGMLGYGPEPEIAKVALETIEAAGFRVVPIVDDATRQEVDEDALNEDLDSLEDWESALRSTIRNQVTAGFNVTAQGDLADLLVRAHRWIAAAYLGRTD